MITKIGEEIKLARVSGRSLAQETEDYSTLNDDNAVDAYMELVLAKARENKTNAMRAILTGAGVGAGTGLGLGAIASQVMGPGAILAGAGAGAGLGAMAGLSAKLTDDAEIALSRRRRNWEKSRVLRELAATRRNVRRQDITNQVVARALLS